MPAVRGSRRGRRCMPRGVAARLPAGNDPGRRARRGVAGQLLSWFQSREFQSPTGLLGKLVHVLHCIEIG